jgi:probable rRNA maturation factor
LGDPDTSGQPPDLEIVLLNRQRRHRIPRQRLLRVLAEAGELLGAGGELAVVFAGDRRMRALNRDYRGQDRATDVLSFAGPGGGEGLGDVVISVETAARNARRLGSSLTRELEVLALHGLLHVLGYDHETDDGTMARLETRLRRRVLGTEAPSRSTGGGRSRRPRRLGGQEKP